MTNFTGTEQIASIAPTGCIASNSTPSNEWPEFRRWYALILEEERLYNVEPTPSDFDDQLDEIHGRLFPLENAMTARQPRDMVQIAMLGIIALRWSERFKAAHNVYRSLELGTQTGKASGHLPETALLEGVVRLALQQNLLPGVVVYDQTGAPI